jgi:hypothetical protein
MHKSRAPFQLQDRRSASTVGRRVVAEGIEEKEMIIAKTVRLAEVAATAKS